MVKHFFSPLHLRVWAMPIFLLIYSFFDWRGKLPFNPWKLENPSYLIYFPYCTWTIGSFSKLNWILPSFPLFLLPFPFYFFLCKYFSLQLLTLISFPELIISSLNRFPLIVDLSIDNTCFSHSSSVSSIIPIGRTCNFRNSIDPR